MNDRGPKNQGQNIASLVIKPGESLSLVVMSSFSGQPEPMIVAVWPDEVCGAGAPFAADLAKLQIAILIDQAPAVSATGELFAGGQQGLPATGMRRQLAAQQIQVFAKLARTATRNISLRAAIGFGVEAGESWVASHAIEAQFEGQQYTYYVIPRFATKWRAWDWGGTTELIFADMASNTTGLPVNIPAASFPDWTPLPPGAAQVLMLATSNCVLQFGRD